MLPLYKSTLSTEVSNKLLIIATPFAGFVSMTFCNDLPFENMYLDLPSPNLTIKSAGWLVFSKCSLVIWFVTTLPVWSTIALILELVLDSFL